LSRLVQVVLHQAQRQLPLRLIEVGLQGEILKDEAL